MTEYYETRPSYRGDHAADENAMRRTITRGSHQSQTSVSASTISWVQANQLRPPPPPPESPTLSPDLTPLRRLRPLPDPQLYQSRGAFQYVGTQEEEEDYVTAEAHAATEQHFGLYTEGNRRGEDGAPVITLPVSPIQGTPIIPAQGRAGRSFVGGFFSGLKRLPKLVLRGSSEDKHRLKHKGTFGTETEGTSTTITGMTRGNTLPRYLSNPSIGPSNPQFAHRLSMAVANGSLPPESTPTAFHLRTNNAGPQFPIVTVTPASDGIAGEEQAVFYDGPVEGQPQYGEETDHDRHLNDRATVMVYGTDSSAPPPTQSVAPPPRLPTPGPRVSYQAQLPTRDRANAQPNTEPAPSADPTSLARGVLNTRPVPSPRDVVSSPSSYTISAVPSFYDPSFASDLTPIEKFFKGLYNLPWVAQERVTIDYRPGDSDRAKAKVKALKKPMASWYRSVMSRSRRGSHELDLLSSGTVSSPRTSFGNTLSPLGSPISRRSGRSSNAGIHDHSSKPKRHRKKRHRGTWISTKSGESGQYMPQRSTSPIIPTTYPYAYPAYHYAYPYGSYPAAMPVPHTSPRGPRTHRRNKAHTTKYQHGYAPYQPMAIPPTSMNPMGPPGPPIYFIAPSPPQSQASGDLLGQGTAAANHDQSYPPTQSATQVRVPQWQPPGVGSVPMSAPMQISPVIMHYVPGGFNQNLSPHNPAMISPPLTPQRQGANGS